MEGNQRSFLVRMTPALGGLPVLCVLHFKRAGLSSTNHLKLSSHIVTDSRENKCKALHHDSDSSSDSDSDLATNKRLRSASVEPPPQPLTLDVSSSSNEPPAPPVNPAPKTIPKSLHFAKNAMVNDTGSNTNHCMSYHKSSQSLLTSFRPGHPGCHAAHQRPATHDAAGGWVPRHPSPRIPTP
jgi:hypothetical protein